VESPGIVSRTRENSTSSENLCIAVVSPAALSNHFPPEKRIHHSAFPARPIRFGLRATSYASE
jgi:hypothetical protein